jgi:hypothetical protein
VTNSLFFPPPAQSHSELVHGEGGEVVGSSYNIRGGSGKGSTNRLHLKLGNKRTLSTKSMVSSPVCGSSPASPCASPGVGQLSQGVPLHTRRRQKS